MLIITNNGSMAPVSIASALALWSDWHLDVPPAGSTGRAADDRRLAAAFRALAALPTLVERLAWLEAQVFSNNDFPNPGAAVDLYRSTLIRWWLDLYETEQPGTVP